MFTLAVDKLQLCHPVHEIHKHQRIAKLEIIHLLCACNYRHAIPPPTNTF